MDQVAYLWFASHAKSGCASTLAMHRCCAGGVMKQLSLAGRSCLCEGGLMTGSQAENGQMSHAHTVLCDRKSVLCSHKPACFGL